MTKSIISNDSLSSYSGYILFWLLTYYNLTPFLRFGTNYEQNITLSTNVGEVLFWQVLSSTLLFVLKCPCAIIWFIFIRHWYSSFFGFQQKKQRFLFFFFNQRKKKVRFLAVATGQKMITRAVEHHGSVVIDFAVVEVHRETS